MKRNNRILSCRPANSEDHQQLENLIHFEILVHRHLDWRPVTGWIGHEPFILLEGDGRLVAALACPVHQHEATWIRLFAASSEISPSEAWTLVWPEAYRAIRSSSGEPVAAIAVHAWFGNLLLKNGFESSNEVMMYQWESWDLPSARRIPKIFLREMRSDDLGEVEHLDHLAFDPLWWNSSTSLELAFRQSAIASVVEYEYSIIAYQISTATEMGGHLARLAIHPAHQGQGIGYFLLRQLLLQFDRRGALQVTVNTQKNNSASLALYKKAGFTWTGESYPVYIYPSR